MLKTISYVAIHQESLIGMYIEREKQAFFNLIQCWPFHKATLFDVTASICIVIDIKSLRRGTIFKRAFHVTMLH